MGFEIDFLPVGTKSKGGDAIALRYGNLYGSRDEQTVIIIDGGYTDEGINLVEHIKTHFNTERVDIVVSTHPDNDHITGLGIVLEELEVGQLLMHQPRNHSSAIKLAQTLGYGALTLSDKLRKSLTRAADLEEIANHRGVPIVEPFEGVQTPDGIFRILGPTQNYYEQLLTEMITGAPGESRGLSALQNLFLNGTTLSKRLTQETHEVETISDSVDTTPQNNSSAICLLSVAGRKLLFTGDAGIPALTRATVLLEAEGFKPGDLSFIQVPHHGSRRNVGPTILGRLLGVKGQTITHSTAYVSAPSENPEHKHPAKKVVNAFTRRGYAVHATQGNTQHHYLNAPDRSGYSRSSPLPFYSFVEDEEAA